VADVQTPGAANPGVCEIANADGLGTRNNTVADANVQVPTPRVELPPRRLNASGELEQDGHRYTVTAGYYADGRLGEIFIDGHKAGSQLAQHAQDAAVLVSMSLQHGVSPRKIAHSIVGPLKIDALDV
jgi:ribonucleoside-diphosphate reductase alpha chain